jgi:predicted porin
LTTIDPFGTGLAGQINNIFDTSGTRLNNSVQYNTPVFSGFNGSIEFAAGEHTGDWKAGREVGAAVTYASGPIYAGATIYDLNATTPGDVTARKTWQIGATYDFGVVKLHGLVQGEKSDPSFSPPLDRFNLMGGITLPVAGGSVMASYLHSNDKESVNRDATQIGVGYMYPLSKRTSLYAAFAHINNQNGGTYTVGNATDSGVGNKAFNLGAVHNF